MSETIDRTLADTIAQLRALVTSQGVSLAAQAERLAKMEGANIKVSTQQQLSRSVKTFLETDEAARQMLYELMARTYTIREATPHIKAAAREWLNTTEHTAETMQYLRDHFISNSANREMLLEVAREAFADIVISAMRNNARAIGQHTASLIIGTMAAQPTSTSIE